MSHTHLIKDSDTSFIIDPITRKITTTSSKVSLMQYDHDSEIFTFQIPKLVEGHDMSLCNKIEIHYTNINKKTKEASSDVYPVTDATVNGNNLIFSWLVSSNATKYPGSLNFLIRFGCLEDDNTFSYLWHTDIFKNITISDGMSNTEAVAEDYSDILEQWRSELIERCADYNNITNAPIKYVKSPDADGNYVIIRDLESGTYVLDGAFYLFKTETASQAANFKWGFPVVIGRTTDKTYVQVLYPPRNTIQYVEITDDGFYQNNSYLNEIDEKFALKTDVYTQSESDEMFALKTDAYTKSESDEKFALKTDAYTKSESDEKFALIEDIPSAVTDDHINSLIDAKLGAIENGSY